MSGKSHDVFYCLIDSSVSMRLWKKNFVCSYLVSLLRRSQMLLPGMFADFPDCNIRYWAEQVSEERLPAIRSDVMQLLSWLEGLSDTLLPGQKARVLVFTDGLMTVPADFKESLAVLEHVRLEVVGIGPDCDVRQTGRLSLSGKVFTPEQMFDALQVLFDTTLVAASGVSEQLELLESDMASVSETDAQDEAAEDGAAEDEDEW